ncbi:Transcriptional regulatory protein moc3 [Lachnellula arida]|uniref:Transcriptional regulatory protein moc3 n=1 Tax=Lachnellula arida TaxID=1316785 RepID=A0A8T9BHG6_9HELO|nr:Transcriptional regulatory protein moc3 [Lachnellula arida]
MSPPKQPRLRASKPKTRTGCKTCRARRVKCDEGKPCCARCLRYGADCEGYEVGVQKAASTRSSLKELLPQTSHREAFLVPSVGKSPFTAVFHDNREYSYFLYFQEEAAPNISGSFDRDLWTHVIIQASWKEPSLSGLVASLGALYKAGSSTMTLSQEETDPHQQYAFQNYGRALRELQARISANPYRDTTRIALIASLLIYCFENIYGEIDSALGHLEGAFRLMQKQLKNASRRYKHSHNVSPTSALDDDLVGAFFRLDSGVLSRDHICEAEHIGSRLGIKYLEDRCDVPERFVTISEARNYLEHIQFPNIPTLSRDLLSQLNTSPLSNIDENTRNMYQIMSFHLRRWNVAFTPLYEETFTQNSKESFAAAATLRVRARSTELASKRVCARDLSPPDLFISESREIVNLSKLVAADPSFRKSFVWDCGIVPGLSIVVAACLDMSIRKEALEVLKQIVPRREGAWDSLTAVKFGERFLQMDGGD